MIMKEARLKLYAKATIHARSPYTTYDPGRDVFMPYTDCCLVDYRHRVHHASFPRVIRKILPAIKRIDQSDTKKDT